MTSSKAKRLDIQTFRALAISAVLAFHLCPDLFPLGYLGVDIFFVLSGYLMSMMLARVTVLSGKNILDFYWRRISRILPMYGVVICSVSIIARFILAPIDYTTLVRDTRWSLVFGANLQQYIDGSDYWAQVNDSPILLHMWSLGAEVQYYFFVPLIAILQRCFRSKNQQLIFLGALTFGSFVSFALYSISNETAAFLLMPNRIWQFTIGAVAWEIDEAPSTKKDELCLVSADNKIERVPTSRIIAILFIAVSLICFSPIQVPIRLPVSIFTGLLLFYGSQNEISILANRFIVKLGNASYVLYLVHWPVITLYKYALDVKTLDHIGVLICLCNSLVISILLHEFVELRLLKASKTTIIVVVAVLYAATLVITSIEPRENVPTVADRKYNFKEVVDWNKRKLGNVGRGDCKSDSEGAKWAAPYNEEWYGRCVAPGKGTARILIIGNSYAGIVVNYLHPMLKPIAKEIRLFAHHGCRILIDGACPKFAAAWPRVVEKMKPDVTWIISREPQLATRPLTEPIENDTTYQFAKGRIDFISNHSKYVVVDYQSVGIILYPSVYPPKTLLRKISKNNLNFSDLQVTEQKWLEFDRNETLRMEKIDNPKLIRHKISEKQCQGGVCYFYNPDNLHVYYSDNYAHQTTEQMELLKPSYSGVIEQLKKLLKL